MNFTELIYSIVAILFILLFLSLIIDGGTSEVTRTYNDSCIDEYNGKFLDEICEYEVECGIITKITDKEYCYGE